MIFPLLRMPADIDQRIQAVRNWAHAVAAGERGPDIDQGNAEISRAVERAGSDWRPEWPRDPVAIARRIALEDRGYGLEGAALIWVFVLILAILVAAVFVVIFAPRFAKAVGDLLPSAGDVTTWLLMAVAGVALWAFAGRGRR